MKNIVILQRKMLLDPRKMQKTHDKDEEDQEQEDVIPNFDDGLDIGYEYDSG